MENIMTCSKWHTFFYFWILHLSSFPLSPNPPYHMFEHKITNIHTQHTHTLSIFQIAPMLVPFGLVFYSFAYLMYKYQVRWSEVKWSEVKWIELRFDGLLFKQIGWSVRWSLVWHSVVWCVVVWCGVVYYEFSWWRSNLRGKKTGKFKSSGLVNQGEY